MVVDEVIGTTRNPDGSLFGEISGLMLRNGGNLPAAIDKVEAIRRAHLGELWCKSPKGGHAVNIDVEGTGGMAYLRTRPEATRTNNLLSLPIFVVRQGNWIDPSNGRWIRRP